jgi:hypothetical protein
VYAQNYHPVQTLPFFGGFLLVIGYVVMMSAIYEIAEEKDKTATLIAVVLTGVFCALIFFNYINQTTFVPDLAKNYTPESDPVMRTFSLTIALLVWAIEMWGYAFLGLATWLARACSARTGLSGPPPTDDPQRDRQHLGSFITATTLGGCFPRPVWSATAPGTSWSSPFRLL